MPDQKHPPNPTKPPDEKSKPSGFPTEQPGGTHKPGPGEQTLPLK